MNHTEALAVLDKFKLRNTCNAEFASKTRRDTGAINLGLKLRIYANHLRAEAHKLREHRAKILDSRSEKCPYYETVKKENPYAHEECSFIGLVGQKDFCNSCDFYLENLQIYDKDISALLAAAKYFEDYASYDDACR